MTPMRFSPSSLREGRWYEYLIRFGLGGVATVFTGFIRSIRRWALPCPSGHLLRQRYADRKAPDPAQASGRACG
jgi:hypothetical protein